MSDAFIPLLKTLPASAAPSDHAARDTREGFVPLAPAGGPSEAPAPLPGAVPEAAPSAGAVAPVILLKREGDQVSHVQIRCSCGEVIELSCIY